MTPNGREGPADLMGGDVMPPPGWPALRTTLTEICLCLTEALPSAESAGVVLFGPDRPSPSQQPTFNQADVIGAAPAGATVLRIEQELGEGPVHTAWLTQSVVTSGDVAADARWRRFGPAVGALELHATVTVPLAGVNGGAAGVLSAYSHQRDAFDGRAVHLIAAIADVTRNALLAAAMVESARRAHQAMIEATDRTRMVNQAVGVLIQRNCTEPQALWRLSRMASSSGEDVAVVARTIVDEARTEARLSFAVPRPPPRSLPYR